MPARKSSEYTTAADEKTLIEELVGTHRLPSEISGFDLEFGEDSAGEPAVWIWFEIEKGFQADDATQKQINKLAEAVSRQLLEKDISRWPYVRFRERA